VTAHAPSLRLNVVANYAGKLWSVASIYLFVPFYIHLLGVAAYGLIAFYSVALAMLFIADAGLSASFARQSARETDPQRLRSLMVSTETMLLGMVGLAGLGMALAAPAIAGRWLQAGQAMSLDAAIGSLRLMPLALVPQVAMSLYMGGLMGQQRQVSANALQAGFTFMRSALVLVPVYLWPDPRVFFAWQALSAWAFLLIMRHTLSARIGGRRGPDAGFSWTIIRTTAGYAGGMFAMSLISGLNTQLDRLVVSRMRPLDEFAFYSLAATLAQVPSLLAVPISAALLPRFTQLVERGDTPQLRRLYEFNCFAMAGIAASSALTIFFFCPEILALWLHGQSVPPALIPVVRILCAGGLFLALQLLPFQLSLAHGHTLTNVGLGAAVLVASVPLQILLTARHGLVGAAVPWLLVNALAFGILGQVLNRRFNDGRMYEWFFRLTLPPLLIGFVVIGCGRLLADYLHLQTLAAMALGLLSLGVAATLMFLARPRSTA